MVVAGFRGTIAEAFAKTIDPNSYLIESSKEGIQKFIDHITKHKPDKVLLLGEYSGKDQDKLRIEIVCSNKFRNTLDGPVFKQYLIPYFIKPTLELKLAKGIGNSWCNLVSYKIVTYFPKMPYTFIHVPKILMFDFLGEAEL